MRAAYLLMLGVLLAASAARADLTGSTVELEQPADGEVPIGAVVEFRFEVTNNSPDANWIGGVTFSFPSCATVQSASWDDSEASNDWQFIFTGAGGSIAVFLDGDDTLTGEIIGADVDGVGEHGWFTVVVAMGEDCPHQVDEILWLLEGDGFGAEPRTLAGSLPIHIYDTPVAGSSWSSVKALY